MEEGMSGAFYVGPPTRAGRGGGGGGRGAKCGRWNPTAEQVKVLTDLFSAGLRTPTTDQIRKISSQLSFYGKIENKNVFYWFQNHKARERQKRRRKVSVDDDDDSKHEDKDHSNISSTKHYSEVYSNYNRVAVGSGEKVVETLQLFPLNSIDESEVAEKLRLCGDNNAAIHYSCNIGTQLDHPMLDLRLSFL